MAADLASDKFWVNKTMYHDAEKKYYENLSKLQRNRQSCVEALGEKEESNNKKLRETKKPLVRNHKNMSKQLDVDALRKELMNLEAKNAKNEKFNSKCNKINSFEIIQRNNEYDLDKNVKLMDSEKKVKQKEVKEKKSKSEKKLKRTKEKEDDPLGGVGMAKLNPDTLPKTSLAGEVAKARQHIKSSLECMDESLNGVGGGVWNARSIPLLEKMQAAIEDLTRRIEILEEQKRASCRSPSQVQVCPAKPKAPEAPSKSAQDDDDDDVDLFGCESEEEDEESKKIREQRLAEYAAKKSKKPALVAKSNIILDIKPWDDETDMKEMEKAVRGIEMDGLVWGASKLVPVAFKIFKLQISCVIEDDKVSVDLLTEKLEEIEDYIQSVDIAAFNKV